MFGSMGNMGPMAAEHPTYGPSVGASSLEYVVGPRGYDGGIHNSPFANGRVKEPFSAPGPYNPFRFQRPWKRRINLLSIFQVVAMLLIVFALTTYLYGFSVHYTSPGLCTAWLCFCTVLCGVFLVKGMMVYLKQRREVLTVMWYLQDDDDTWFMFLFVAILVSCLLGYLVGNIIYASSSQPYYTLSQLHNYTAVDPVSGGKAYLDAGAIDFAKGSFVDISHGLGYKDSDVFCVAPVKLGNQSTANFDFFATGVNCCNGFPGDFNCFDDRKDVTAVGGIRVIDDSLIPKYKLAVMQASQEWGKPSPNPIFLTWVKDPSKKIQSMWHDSVTTYSWSIVIFFILECAAVAIMTSYFWRKRLWG